MPNTDAVNTLIFDWDGTLVDSATLGLAAFQKTFAELDCAFPLDVYEAHYSPNWYSTYEALGLPKEKWQQADDLWLQHYGTQTALLIEGSGETLLELSRRGYTLAVVSSGNEPRVCREIESSVLRDAFAAVVCHEHITNKKPHPEGLEIALRKLKCEPRQAAYVGDAPEDIAMGKAGRVLTVGVRSNYPSSARLLSASPDIHMDQISELAKWFK
jgi:HAD superfamily hydrolase (TIGR01509 family)